METINYFVIVNSFSYITYSNNSYFSRNFKIKQHKENFNISTGKHSILLKKIILKVVHLFQHRDGHIY